MEVDIKTLQREHRALFDKKYWAWVENSFDYEWWDGVFECFVEDMKEHGVCVDCTKRGEPYITFNLGYSQGDYAAFEGQITMTTWMEKHGYKTRYYPLWLDMENYGAKADISRPGPGGSLSLDYWPGNCEPCNIFEGMEQDAWDSLVTTMFEAEDWEKLLKEWLNATCSGLYKKLQEEYEYLSSEEQFIEAMCDEVFEVDTEEEEV